MTRSVVNVIDDVTFGIITKLMQLRNVTRYTGGNLVVVIVTRFTRDKLGRISRRDFN